MTDRTVGYDSFKIWIMFFFAIHFMQEWFRFLSHYIDLVLQTYYQPAIDRSRPSILEMRLSLPPNSITTVSIEFDKVFLKYTEHRPDANRGFDVG